LRHPPVPTSCGVDQVERETDEIRAKNFSEARYSMPLVVTFGGKTVGLRDVAC